MEKTFEQAYEELEKIIEELEHGNLTLKENIEKFKQGSELLEWCKKELENTELTIKKIIEENGSIKFEDLNK